MQMPSLKKKQFLSNLKDILWPIERSELKLFVPMSLMMLCILFNFGALRSIKDSLVVPNIGAEVISFLKLWLVLPSTIIFTLIYAKLSNMFDYERVFYLIVSFFLGFFIFFTYVLYPNQDFYHPNSESIQRLATVYPNFKWFILIAGKWTYAAMYVFCELWSAVVINLLFWQYANNIFDTKSAKRFYPILSMVGNVGLIMAGTVLVTFSDISILDDEILDNQASEQYSAVLEPIMITIIVSGWMGVSCVIVALIGSNVLRKFSWRAAALTTPCIISCTGIIFFVFVIYANDIGVLGGFSPIYLAVVIGAIQNILSKSTKYSLFDSTKEMTYIPLTLELRTKGKAAVEVVGLKFGKSLGAFAQSFIFILMPTASFDSVTMYLMVIFILIIILWIWDIRKLDQEYNKIKGDKE